MHRATRVLIMLMAVFLAGAAFLPAQTSETDELHALRAAVQADRQAVVAVNLGLSDDEAKAFWPIYRQYREELSKVGDRLQQLIQDYARVYESITDDKAKTMTDEYFAIQIGELEIKKKFLKEFRGVLPEAKVMRFVQIENKLDALIGMELADSIPLATPAD